MDGWSGGVDGWSCGMNSWSGGADGWSGRVDGWPMATRASKTLSLDNKTTSSSCSRISSPVDSSGELIISLMDDNGLANDRVCSTQKRHFVLHVNPDNSFLINLDIAKIPDMPVLLVMGTTMIVLIRIEVSTSSVAVVTEVTMLMNMNSMQTLAQTRQFSCEICRVILLFNGQLPQHLLGAIPSKLTGYHSNWRDVIWTDSE